MEVLSFKRSAELTQIKRVTLSLRRREDVPETQMIQTIVLGYIAFRMSIATPLNPDSPQARKIASSLARSLNRRLLQVRMIGKLPRCPIAAEVLNIRSGSLIVYLELHASIPTERNAVAALWAFAKAYPGIRKAVLELAGDIKIVAANVFGAVAGVVEVQLEEAGLLNPTQVETSIRLVEERQRRSDVAPVGSANLCGLATLTPSRHPGLSKS